MTARTTLEALSIGIDTRDDAWGTSMGALFDIAHALEHYGRDYSPAEWRFRDSIICSGLDKHPSGENDTARTVAAAILRGHENAIVHAGNVLNRYTDLLRTQGRSY